MRENPKSPLIKCQKKSDSYKQRQTEKWITLKRNKVS